MSRNLHIIKKDDLIVDNQIHSIKDKHLNEISCFYYLNNNVVTIKNNSRIIINRENSLSVIKPPPFQLQV